MDGPPTAPVSPTPDPAQPRSPPAPGPHRRSPGAGTGTAAAVRSPRPVPSAPRASGVGGASEEQQAAPEGRANAVSTHRRPLRAKPGSSPRTDRAAMRREKSSASVNWAPHSRAMTDHWRAVREGVTNRLMLHTARTGTDPREGDGAARAGRAQGPHLAGRSRLRPPSASQEARSLDPRRRPVTGGFPGPVAQDPLKTR